MRFSISKHQEDAPLFTNRSLESHLLESFLKFEAIFKSLDEMSSKNNRGDSSVNGPNNEESPWQLQKHFEQAQKPPSPEPQRQIPQVPGPCDPEDLVDGVLFAANYLGSTQLLVDKNSTKTARMMQAQEAMTRVKGMTHRLSMYVRVFVVSFSSASKYRFISRIIYIIRLKMIVDFD